MDVNWSIDCNDWRSKKRYGLDLPLTPRRILALRWIAVNVRRHRDCLPESGRRLDLRLSERALEELCTAVTTVIAASRI